MCLSVTRSFTLILALLAPISLGEAQALSSGPDASFWSYRSTHGFGSVMITLPQDETLPYLG